MPRRHNKGRSHNLAYWTKEGLRLERGLAVLGSTRRSGISTSVPGVDAWTLRGEPYDP